jgi:phosphoribosylanthranilate isomerase
MYRFIFQSECIKELFLMVPRIKICCIQSIAEAKMAIDYGASALGLVGQMPSGPGVIDDSSIASIARSVPPPISTFLLTSETSAGSIISHYKKTYTSAIQLVDEISEESFEAIRSSTPGVKLVQVIHVRDERSVEYALEVESSADALLLDSGNPNAETKILGGTGKTHNWELSKKIVEQVHIPVFLAGGLTADNIKQALDQVQPFGIDLCSGIRTNHQLDEEKLSKFMMAAGF